MNMNETLFVSIYHRTDPDRFREFGKSDRPTIKEVYRYEVASDMLRSDQPHAGCFRINNRVDGSITELPELAETASLSVGDVVEVFYGTGRTYWAVDNFGWSIIPKDEGLRAKVFCRWDERRADPRGPLWETPKNLGLVTV